eukprot:m.14363 g.14363  ORF g.14363 m.14363 type:complete len:472 (+) comp5069_c0_seq1:255-1670(+)
MGDESEKGNQPYMQFGDNGIVESVLDEDPLLATDNDFELKSKDDVGLKQGPGVYKPPTGSLFSLTVNLSNTILGAGLLALPYAFGQAGTAVGATLLVFAGLGSTLGLHLLAVSQDTVGIKPSSFYTVASAAFPSLTSVIDIAVAVKCFGVGTSYLIVVGDMMPDAMEYFGGYSNRQIWVLIGWALVVPLACLKSLNALRFTSTLSMVFISGLVIMIILYASNIPGLDPCEGANMTPGERHPCKGKDTELYESPEDTLKVLSIFVFAFTCQQNIFAVSDELKNPTIKRIDTVIEISIGFAFCVFLSVAIAGRLTFGDSVYDDVLLNYPKNLLVSIARVCIAVLVLCTYPLQVNPCRKCLLSLYAATTFGGLIKAPANGLRTTGNVVFYAITFGFLLGSLAIAMTVTNLGTVLAVVGATGSTTVSYILPGIIYYRLHPGEGCMRILSAIQFVAGCIIMPTALVSIFLFGGAGG